VVDVLPLAGVRRTVEHLGLAAGRVHQLLARRPLGAQPATRDRGIGVALDLDDLLALPALHPPHVDPLTAADRAVGADTLHDPVSGRGTRRQATCALGGHRWPAAGPV